MRTLQDQLRYFRWWLFGRLRYMEAVLLILLGGLLITASGFFWFERNLWHSYEMGKADVVDRAFVFGDEDVKGALWGGVNTCKSIGGFRCAPQLISIINLQIDDFNGDLLASVEMSGIGTVEQAREAKEARVVGFGHRDKSIVGLSEEKSTVLLTGFNKAVFHMSDSYLFPKIMSNPRSEQIFLKWESERVFVANGVDAWWFRPFSFYKFRGQFFLLPEAATSFSKEQRISGDRIVGIEPLVINAPPGYLLGKTSCRNSNDRMCFYLHRSYGAMAFAVFLMSICFVPIIIASKQTPGSLRPVDLLSTLVIYGAIRVTIVGGANPQLLAPAFVDAFFGVFLVWMTYIYLRH